VRAIAAQALSQYGSDADVAQARDTLVELASAEKNSNFVAMLAAIALDEMGERARPAKDRIMALPQKSRNAPPRTGEYIGRLVQKLRADMTAGER